MPESHPGIDALIRMQRAPEWDDLPVDEKQAQIDYVLEHNLYPDRPDLADEARPLLYSNMGAVPPPKILGPLETALQSKPVQFALEPLVKLSMRPGEAGDFMLQQTGSPAIAAATDVGRQLGEGFSSPLSIVLPGATGVIQGIKNLSKALRPAPGPTAPPPPAPGMARFAAKLPPGEVQGPTMPSAPPPATDPFLVQLEAQGKTIARDPRTGQFGIVDKKVLERGEFPKPGKQPVFPKETRAKDFSNKATIIDKDGVRLEVRVNPAEAARLGRLSASLSASASSPHKPSKKWLTIPDETMRSGYNKARITDELESASTPLPGVAVPPQAAVEEAKKARAAYYGTDFRKQFKENTDKGNPVADNVADPAEMAGRVVPPDVPAVASAKYPNAFWRFNDAAIDVLGRFGDDGAAAAKRMHQIYDTSEGATMQLMSRWVDDMERIFGKRSAWSLERMNPFASSEVTRLFNITKAEADNVIDVLYTQGKVRPMNTRVEQAVTAYSRATKEINAHPGVRGATVRNPFTGVEKPVGEATDFFPQQPITIRGREGIQFTRSEAAFKNAVKEAVTRGETLTHKEWADRLTKIEQSMIGNLDPYYAGVNAARTFDAAQYGLPSQVLKTGGYETDLMRSLFRYLSKTSLFAERQVAKEEMSVLQSRLMEKHPTTAFPRQVFDLAMGQGKVDIVDDVLNPRRFGAFMRELNTATLLQLAGISSLPQTSYAIAQAGPVAAAKGLAKYMGDKWAGRVMDVGRSGAVYSHWVQEMTAPQTALGVWAQGLLRSNGFTAVDRVGRVTAGYMGAAAVTKQAQNLAKYAPGQVSQDAKLYHRAEAMLREVHLDPAAILTRRGKLTQDEVLLAAQVFANQTMGRTSIQGLPAWTQGENAYLRMALQFKNFLFANSAQMSRTIRNSPDAYTGVKRALVLATGTQISGEVVNDMTYVIRNSRLGEGYLADPFEKEERGARGIEKAMRHAPFAHVMNTRLGARVIENWVQGVGTVWAGIMISGMPDADQLIASIVGPTATTVAKAVADAGKLAGGEIMRPGTSHLAEDLARRLPFVGPTVSQGVRDARRRQNRSPLHLPGTKVPSVFGNRY